MTYEALESLLQTLKQILNTHKDDLITPPVKQEIIPMVDHASVLQLLLKSFPGKESIREVQQKERIREAANTTQELIEYILSEEKLSDCGSIEPTVRLSSRLRELAEKLESTAGDVVDFLKSNDSVKPSDSPDVSSSSRPAPTSKDVVVGLDQDLEVLKDRLLERSDSLQVLPIVGMGGIGKTTLAKIVYNDASIVECFDVCAWVTISQDYSVGSIVVNLLASLKEISAERNFENEIPMESLIRKYLEGRRYLIVMDDMWSKKAWDDVKMLFPDNNRGSRIILTTRLLDVAAYAVDSCSSIHTMRLLDSNHSWNLLHQKVFADENCPLELEDVAKKIVKDCGGLPLSLVVAAGLLSKIPKSRYSWKQIAANDVQLETIICLSYIHLPDHSKACFLYMAAFPEDYEIHASELIPLWVAEGFIKCPNTSKSLEEEAEDCLEDLVERSLVLMSSRKFDGKIKSCSLHDSVREFCIRQAGKEKVILPVMDYLPTPILRSHFLPRLLKDHHSISASSHDLHFKDTAHSSHIRTIICISQKGHRSVGSVEKFSSLRIFHVLRRSHHLDWEPGQVFDLIHLTHLASNIPSSIVPPAISKLQNLQTLIIYSSGVHLPVEIWKLRQLKYLIAFSFDHLPHPENATLPLKNLHTLSLVKDFVWSDTMVKMIPNIQKLGISYSVLKFDAGYHFIYLTMLLRLENLKLEACSSYCWSLIHFYPLSLKKLTLSGWAFDWSSMTIVGSLPNLQVLKLRNLYGSLGQWKTIEGEFVNLRFLLIDKSHLRDWTTESSHFPRLECLILRHCKYLNEIPEEIGDIPTIKLIEVDDWPRDVLDSAKRIEEKQRKSGNDSFQVRVKHIAANELDTIICLSYTHLPDHSKAFFLYMAAFPEDYEIHVSELIKLWVAEGFIKCPNTSKSLEEEAEDCLEDLVERSLVLVSSRKFDGKIKSCYLHDSVREFCIRQAGKEKVILPVMDYLPTPILRSHFLPRLLKDHHRISACSHDLHLKDTAHSSHIRTIICISQKGYRSVGSVEKFSSLRVFHVLRRSHYLDWEPGQVFDLIHLTYLAFNIPSSIVPPAILKLQNLETLIIYRSGVHLPVEIWKLGKLKYLIAFSFDHLPHPESATLPLENLQTLSLVKDFVWSDRMVKMIPNIQKLGIRYTEKKFDAVYDTINLTHLLRLENLRLEMREPSCWSWNHLFPVSLKKLTLSGRGFRWICMRIVGSLPNLQVLKLRNLDCSYGQWKTNEGEFVNLRFLLIDKSDLRHWTTESSHFPRLECLILYHCNYLYEIPKEIGDIPTMKLIEVDDDDQCYWFSAKSIEYKQQISGNYSFQLRVKRY